MNDEGGRARRDRARRRRSAAALRKRPRRRDRGRGGQSIAGRATAIATCAASSPQPPSTTPSGRCRCNRSSTAARSTASMRERMQTPASTQKLITSAVAAERLGWDYRYTTRIYATGPLSSGGDLDGDLVIVSNGDPTINPRHPDRSGAFDAWAKQLYAKGVRRVGGQLIGDDNAFAEPGWGFGWAWDDLSLGYGAAVGALQYNENQVELLIGPGLEAGGRAIISVSPPGSGIILDHARDDGRGGAAEPRLDRAHSRLEHAQGQRPGRDRLAGDQRARRRAQPDDPVSQRAARGARAQRHLRRRQPARHRRCAASSRTTPRRRCCSRIDRRRSMRSSTSA